MENNETWRERLKTQCFCNDGAIDHKPASFACFYDKDQVAAFISAELLSLADKIGAEKFSDADLVTFTIDSIDSKEHALRHNKALDTAISIIKEMVK